MDQWANYFIATAGAAAALTGLIFVSVSINLQRILSITYLPTRALGSLVLLTNILIISSLCLIPKQPVFWLGCEIFIPCLIILVLLSRGDIILYKSLDNDVKKYYFQNILFTQLALLPYLVASVYLLCGSYTGLYWLIPAITFSFIKALVDSWVLLVEINR